MSDQIEIKDAFFKKHMLIPSLIFIFTVIMGTKTVVTELRVELKNITERLDDYAESHVTKDQMANVLAELRFRSDDPYRGADALRDFNLRDEKILHLQKSLDRQEHALDEILNYLRDRWGWKGSKPEEK